MSSDQILQVLRRQRMQESARMTNGLPRQPRRNLRAALPSSLTSAVLIPSSASATPARSLLDLPTEILLLIFNEILGGDGYAMVVHNSNWRTGEPHIFNKGHGFWERFRHLGGELSNYMLSKELRPIVQEAFFSNNFFDLTRCNFDLRWLRGVAPAHLELIRKVKIEVSLVAGMTTALINFLQANCGIKVIAVTSPTRKYWSDLKTFQELPEVVALCRFRGLRIVKIEFDSGPYSLPIAAEKTWLEAAMKQKR